MIFDANELYSAKEIDEVFRRCIYCNDRIWNRLYSRKLDQERPNWFFCNGCLFTIDFHPSNSMREFYNITFAYRISKYRIKLSCEGAWLKSFEGKDIKKIYNYMLPVDLLEFKENIVDKYRLLI